MASLGCNILLQRNVFEGNRGTWKTCNILCLAPEGRGFGPEPIKREKSNNGGTRKLKEGKRSGPEPNLFYGESRKTGRQAPELASGTNERSKNIVLDREFIEKVEAVRRSALEQKKAEEDKFTQAIDYDAPIESDKTTVGLGAKVGVGIAVVVFGLVFALGDFVPSGRNL